MTADALLSRLERVKKTGPGRWRCGCPAHGKGVKGSLSVAEGADGRVLMHCHAGCDVASVCAAVGLELDALFPPKVPDDKRPPPLDRPFKREHIQHLSGELMRVLVILNDVAANRPIPISTRARAGEAASVCADLLRELA